jgi:outer membrane lipase/esterase
MNGKPQPKRAMKRLLPALVAATLSFGAVSAEAVTFSGVYVFGDSLSDAGYFRPQLAGLGVPAQAVPLLGRFTTNPGPVWAELVATYYGGIPSPNNQGGQNYAQGGARVAVSSPSTPPGANPNRSVATQITEFLASSGGRADPNGLYSVWAGANDIFQTLPAIGAGTVNPATFLAQTTAAEVQQIGRLQAAGARYILVFGLPDIGATPAFANPALGATPAQTAAGTQLSAGYNTNLFNAIAASRLRVIPVDTFTLLREVTANAAAFGFTNITLPACQPVGSSALTCSAANSPAGSSSTFLYADPVHPTSAAHAITADFVKALIDGPNAYSTMAEVPLATRAAHVRTLDTGLRTGMSGAVGKVSVFAAGDGGKSDIESNRLSPANDSKNRSGTVGVTFRASEAFTFGLAIGKTTADANMGSLGKFSTDESVLSAFGSFKADGAYFNFTGTYADIKFDDIQRNVKLGQVMRVNRANTKGSNSSANFTAGYDFAFGKFSVGPFLALTTQGVTVDGFSESGSAQGVLSTDLKIGQQNRDSQITSLGARASFDLGNWTPFARVSVEQERKREERLVTATPLSIAQNLAYEIPGYRPGRKWGLVSLGVRGSFTDRISMAIVYTGTFSRTNVKEGGVAANITFQF